MRADTEGHVLARLAVNVVNVPVRRVLTVVAACRANEHHHDAPFGHGPTVVLDVSRDIACGVGSRRFIAQQLLDCLRDESRIVDQGASLVGILFLPARRAVIATMW